MVNGFSSINNVQSIIETEPFASTWFTVSEERTPIVELRANKNYWDPERGPRLQQVTFRNDLTKEQALHLCMNTEGAVDIVTQVPPEKANLVQHSKFAKLVSSAGNSILAGTFNRFLYDVNFNEPKLRLALNLAVDQDEIISKAFCGHSAPVPALTPTWAFDFPEELTPREFNPNIARQLFQESSWPRGRELRIASPKNFEKVAKLIASQISKALQIKVNVNIIQPVEQLKWKRVVAEKMLIPSWDILLANPVALFYEGTPAFFHREFFGYDGALRSGPRIPQFEARFNEMVMETNKEKFLEKAKDVDRYVYEEALALFICAPYNLYAVNKHVHFKPYRTSFELVDTEVDKGHWSRN